MEAAAHSKHAHGPTEGAQRRPPVCMDAVPCRAQTLQSAETAWHKLDKTILALTSPLEM